MVFFFQASYLLIYSHKCIKKIIRQLRPNRSAGNFCGLWIIFKPGYVIRTHILKITLLLLVCILMFR